MSFWNGNFGFKNNSVSMARSPTPGGPFRIVEHIALQGGKVQLTRESWR